MCRGVTIRYALCSCDKLAILECPSRARFASVIPQRCLVQTLDPAKMEHREEGGKCAGCLYLDEQARLARLKPGTVERVKAGKREGRG